MSAGQQRPWTDERFEVVLGTVLRTGVLSAAAVVLCGGIVFLSGEGGSSPEYRAFHGEPSELRSLAGILTAARSLDGRGLIQLGVLLLIATPVTRVAFALGGFLRQRSWWYVTISATVLALLAYALGRA